MNKYNFNHEHTPSDLAELNLQIANTLSAEELDDTQLLSLVNQRDMLIVNLLDTLDEQEKKAFVEAEVVINNRLETLIKSLFRKSLGQLSGFIRGKKAVQKYK